MNLSLSLKQSYKLEQKLVMKSRYVTSGDLELLSLHRIKNRIHSLDIESPLKSKLIGELIRENREYRKISKNKWNCITPISLDVAVDNTYNFLKDQVKLGVETIDDIQVKSVLNKFLFNKAKEQNGNIKKWFSNNYDKILYDMNGNPIPVEKPGILKKGYDKIKKYINPLAGLTSQKPQVPPLPNTPMPNVATAALQKSPQTGLTRSETALLSPSEQEIARRT